MNEVEEAIAQVLDDRGGYLDVTQEEFVVGMEQKLTSYKDILRGIEDLHGPDQLGFSDRLTTMNDGVAEMAQQILDVKTTLEPSWTDKRRALIQTANDLERELIAAWDDVRR